ncbi:MAG: methylmalonyl-CoA mutase family protein [Acidobacteriota bacterium]
MPDKDQQTTRETTSGAEIKPVYGPGDVSGDPGAPGSYPYTRGIQPDMYRGRLWTMRQYAGFGTAEESNARYRYLLSQGTTGLSVAFDLPTQIGYDSDHPLANGEVGRVGVAIDSIEDMETLFDQIPLEQVSVSMTINATAPILLALYVGVAERRGIDPGKLSGTIQNDVLKEYAARGTYIYPPKASMKLATDIFDYGTEKLPKWNTISVSGYHIREAGSTAAEEVGFTLAHAIAYAEAARARRIPLAAFLRRLSFFFNAHNDLLEEVAKFRAARRLWARIVKERFGVDDARAQMLRFHTQTAGSTLTAREPEVNVVRVALQALAAVLGGTQSLHTNSRDEALALPTEAAARLALRTQQVIAYESGVAATADPLGGSYYVEALTSDVEHRALELIAQVDKLGGAIAALDAGFTQERIQDSAYRAQKAMEAGALTVVSVNRFREEGRDAPIETLRVDPRLEEEQVARLRALRARRNDATTSAAVAAVSRAAVDDGNVIPPMVEAVKAHATLGEIADALRAVYGEHRERA